MVVAEAVHVIYDGRRLLLEPYVHALCRVGLVLEQHGGIHTVGAEVVLPCDVGARGGNLHGGIGHLRGRLWRAFAQDVACSGTMRHGGLETDGGGIDGLEGHGGAGLVEEG